LKSVAHRLRGAAEMLGEKSSVTVEGAADLHVG
jgi:hypothetical protein